MSWEYNLDENDYVEFNLYHAKNSPKFRRNLFIQRFIVSLLFLIVPFVMYYLFDRPLMMNLIMFGVIWIVWIAFFSISVKRALKKKVTQQVKKADEKGEALTGKYTVREVNDGLMLGNKRGEVKIKWKAIGKLGEDDERFYIYIGAEMAYILKKSAFKSDSEMESFRQKVEANMTKDANFEVDKKKK